MVLEVGKACGFATGQHVWILKRFKEANDRLQRDGASYFKARERFAGDCGSRMYVCMYVAVIVV